jgi:hypothetical protein
MNIYSKTVIILIVIFSLSAEFAFSKNKKNNKQIKMTESSQQTFLDSNMFGKPVFNYAIKFNPLSIVYNCFNFQYQYANNKKRSFQVGGYFLNYKDNIDRSDSYNGFGITPEYRFYLTGKENMTGWFVGPYLRYEYFSHIYTNYYKIYESTNYTGDYHYENKIFTGNAVQVGAILGYQKTWTNGFTFETFLGIGYHNASIKDNIPNLTYNNYYPNNYYYDNSTYEKSFKTGFKPTRLGISIGYAF